VRTVRKQANGGALHGCCGHLDLPAGGYQDGAAAITEGNQVPGPLGRQPATCRLCSALSVQELAPLRAQIVLYAHLRPGAAWDVSWQLPGAAGGGPSRAPPKATFYFKCRNIICGDSSRGARPRPLWYPAPAGDARWPTGLPTGSGAGPRRPVRRRVVLRRLPIRRTGAGAGSPARRIPRGCG
jgi:hypothetical protein